MSIIEYAYIGRDNSIDVQLLDDGVPKDITVLTRVRLELFDQADLAAAPVVVDSTIVPSAFDWSAQGISGILMISLGAVLAVVADYNVRMIVYDSSAVNGIVWTHEITVGCEGSRFVIRALDAADAA